MSNITHIVQGFPGYKVECTEHGIAFTYKITQLDTTNVAYRTILIWMLLDTEIQETIDSLVNAEQLTCLA